MVGKKIGLSMKHFSALTFQNNTYWFCWYFIWLLWMCCKLFTRMSTCDDAGVWMRRGGSRGRGAQGPGWRSGRKRQISYLRPNQGLQFSLPVSFVNSIPNGFSFLPATAPPLRSQGHRGIGVRVTSQRLFRSTRFPS